ncbi:hypothetical protein [Halalkalibacter sp. APA_J-10(15)]|uniref:hypothetical protein n=1 Tax=Halalkalibacter sp. APA_J-10(15) TaxID=2933805 RepID=UPI001FF25808|nr:hypothetical protein [Halalkalibacter sp. APA_J-10(15)]MCK0471687.1 hypothetical protein [Halalkalibacter sp. APA_J-10(15)]
MVTLFSWFLILAPWPLLIPLNSTRVRQFVSVAFFTFILNSIIFQMAEIYNWWEITNNVPFLTSIASFSYGFLPVITIIVFYFTYPNPWLFFGVNLFIDTFQAFVISPFVFEKIGLYELNTINHFGLFLLILVNVPFIYFYQKWYEKKLDYSS